MPARKPRIKVQISILHMGWIRHSLVTWLAMLMRTEHRYTIQFGCHTKIPTSGNRNQIAKLFLESSNDFLLMLDNDVSPHNNLLDMIEKDLDVVGFPCPVWRGLGDPSHVTVRWNFSPLDGSKTINMKEQQLVEVSQIGSGGLLIARRVLEHPDMRAPFKDQFDDDGVRELGHDFLFCRRAREAGFRVWAATQHLCGHVKERDLIDVFKALIEAANIHQGETDG